MRWVGDGCGAGRAFGGCAQFGLLRGCLVGWWVFGLGVAEFVEGGAGFGGFVPGEFVVGVEDAVFVAFAEEEHDVAGGGAFASGADGGWAVGDGEVVGSEAFAGAFDAAGDFGDDGVAVFSARVFVGEDDEVAGVGGDLALEGAFFVVAFAAAAEDGDEFAGGEWAHDGHEFFK